VTLPALPTSSDRSADIGVVVEPQREVVEVRTDDERAVYVVEPVVATNAVVPTVLADLTDVDSTPPTDGQVLTFDSDVAKWAPATADTTALTARVTALEGRPVVDSPDDIGAAPAGAYATDAELAAGLADKADLDHTHSIASVTGLQAGLDAKAPLSSPTFTGTVSAPRVLTPPVTLADAATVATDAALGNHFRVTLGGNRTLGAPANPADGQKALWELIQDVTGGRVLTLSGGTGGFAVGADGPVVLSTAPGARDFLGAVYSAALSRWLVLALAKGF
jgi:hypothetical protein